MKNRKLIVLIILAIVILTVTTVVLLRNQKRPDNPPIINEPVNPEHPKAPELVWIRDLNVPEYNGKPYISLNNGQPFFETDSLSTEAYEIYYDLDRLGRCTLAEATLGKETMPTGKRGDISSIKPTGWHSSRYPEELVNGESLYNRCHLIAYGLSAEEANKYNLVTGTRYFNTEGINSFENMVIDYIRETGNHVHYRVTPIFTGDNLICDGQVVEAYSIEDDGDGVCFCVYSYNVQPGIEIDYRTGDNWLSGTLPEKKEEKEKPEMEDNHLLKDFEGDFILNTKSKRIHSLDCEGASTISDKNRETYHGSYNELIDMGYLPDDGCQPYIKD